MSYSKFIFKCIFLTHPIGLLVLLASVTQQRTDCINKLIYSAASWGI